MKRCFRPILSGLLLALSPCPGTAGPPAGKPTTQPVVTVGQAEQAIRACTRNQIPKHICAERFFEDCSRRDEYSNEIMVQCEHALTSYWKLEMDNLYRLLMNSTHDPLKNSLQQTQQAWQQWREQRCQPWKNMDGPIYQLIQASCVTRTVRDRVYDLEELLNEVRGQVD